MGKKGKGKKQVQQEEHEGEVGEQKEQENQNGEKIAQQKTEVEILQPKKVQYCPICTLPFEFCKYGKKASDCKKFLMEIAPTKVSKYHPDDNVMVQQQDGEKKEQSEKSETKKQAKQAKEPKKQKSVKDKYILIDVKSREKKKFTSEVSGLSIFDIDSKQLSKKLSKKFACSCSATDNDKILVQGDFFEDIKEILIGQYKVKKKYILDKDQYKEKVGEEKQKKKEQRKKEKDVIVEVPQEKQQDTNQPQAPKYKNQIQQALADLDDDEDDK